MTESTAVSISVGLPQSPYAGMLHVGYHEFGPSDGPVLVLLSRLLHELGKGRHFAARRQAVRRGEK